MDRLPLAISDILVALLAFWLMRQLQRRDPSAALGWWSAAFLCQAITTAALIHRRWEYNIPALEILAAIAAMCAATFLAYGCLRYLGRSASRWWLTVPVFLAVFSGVGSAIGISFIVLAIPISLTMGGSLLFAGIALVRRAEPTVGTRLAGTGMVLYGLHIFDFPLISAYPDFMPWGHMVATFLQVMIATGFMLLHLEAAQHRLAEREAMYRALFENAAVGIFVAGTDGAIIATNDTLKILLASDEDLNGQQVSEWFVKAGGAAPLFDQSAPGVVACAGQWRSTAGNLIDVQIYGRWVETINEGVTLEGVVVDVTRMEQLEKHLGQVQRSEILGQLSGGIAHDINNILTVVHANAEVLRRKLPAELPEQRYVESIANASNQGGALTRQLLTFTRRHPEESLTFALGPRVALAAEMLRPTLGESIALEVEVSENEGLIHANPSLIEQLVVNLVINARDALVEGGNITVRVRCSSESSNGTSPSPNHIELTVTDNGIGMDEVTQARVFEPFFSTKEASKGTGLGLTVVERVSRQSGATLEVISEPGAGTTVTVRFPVAATPTADHIPAAAVAPKSHTPLRILLVEDREELRLVVAESLTDEGMIVEAPKSSVLALEYINGGNPIDVVVTDVRMPAVSGQEIARAMVARDANAPIVFISGFADQCDLLAGFRPETTRFVSKPFLPSELVIAVEAVTKGANEHRPRTTDTAQTEAHAQIKMTAPR